MPREWPDLPIKNSGYSNAPVKVTGALLRSGALQCYCNLVAAVSDHVVVLGVGVQVVHGQPCARVAGVSHLAVADVYGYVGNATVAEEDEVT